MIKKSGAGKWELDLISVKKIIIWAMAIASVIVSNTDLVTEILSPYLYPKIITLILGVCTIALLVREQMKHDYSK